jgi:hypothetical protein
MASNIMEWVSDAPSGAWAVVFTPLLIGLLIFFSRGDIKADKNGWFHLRPSIALHFFGIMFLAMAIFFSAFPFIPLFAEYDGLDLVFILLGPLLAAGMWYAVYSVYGVRVRFNDDYIVYRGLIKTIKAPWNNVTRIVDSVALGTFVDTTEGRLIIWRYFKGFPQFIETALRHGVDVDKDLLK